MVNLLSLFEALPFWLDLEIKKHSKLKEDKNQLYIYFILNYINFDYDAKVEFLDTNIEIYFITYN